MGLFDNKTTIEKLLPEISKVLEKLDKNENSVTETHMIGATLDVALKPSKINHQESFSVAELIVKLVENINDKHNADIEEYEKQVDDLQNDIVDIRDGFETLKDFVQDIARMANDAESEADDIDDTITKAIDG